MKTSLPYQALALVSFGGPEKPEEVLPFLDRVLRGRNVPPERKLEVAEHYHHFGGRSPINAQTRALKAEIERELQRRGIHMPAYWGNRNWHPLLEDTAREMRGQGIERALALVTSAFGSYSGCRQYREDLDRATEAAGGGIQFDKIGLFYAHPGFIAAQAERLAAAFDAIPRERQSASRILFTAHSIPLRMAQSSPYAAQLETAAQLTIQAYLYMRPELAALANAWRLVYQSRSGPPSQPWLEPDILAALEQAAAAGARDVVAAPIGFISDHMEVIYDLDYEARDRASALGLNFYRAATVGLHPAFIHMIGELVEERLEGKVIDTCAPDCCITEQTRR